MSALFLQKSARHQKTSSTQTTSRHYDKKNPERAIFEFFLIKLRRTIRATSRQDPPAPCSNSKRLEGYNQMDVLFLQKALTTRRSQEALQGFAPESTRMTFCSYSTRLERAKRDFQSSTMKCSGACRCGTHRIPRKRERRSSPTRILPM